MNSMSLASTFQRGFTTRCIQDGGILPRCPALSTLNMIVFNLFLGIEICSNRAHEPARFDGPTT